MTFLFYISIASKMSVTFHSFSIQITLKTQVICIGWQPESWDICSLTAYFHIPIPSFRSFWELSKCLLCLARTPRILNNRDKNDENPVKFLGRKKYFVRWSKGGKKFSKSLCQKHAASILVRLELFESFHFISPLNETIQIL